MSTDTKVHPRKGSSVSLVLLLLVAAGGIYVGMRWHTTFERWLVPSAVSAPATTRESTSQDHQQLWTCGMHPQVIQDHPGDCPICHMKLTPLITGGDTQTQTNTSTVAIDPVVVQNMGIRTAEVTQGPLGQTVRVSAMVDEAESAHRDVNLRVSGWIQTLYANTDGMELKKGDPLFDLYSPDLRLAIEELISARNAASTAGSEATGLGISGDSLVAAAESRLLALDLTPEQISELGRMEHAPHTVTIVSPIDGHVTAKADVYTGTSVMAGQRVLRLAERTTMWIEGRVPENEIARVRIGQKTSVKIDAFPGRTFAGEVSFIHPHFDEATRTALVRTVLTNQDHALHQGMYATIDIDVGDGESVILVPREAIIDTGESQVVFMSMDKGRFEPRKVAMGRSGEHGLVQVLSGLKPGEQVVASGQFLLDSESRLREAIAKFLGQKSTVTAEQAAPAVSTPAKSIAVSPEKVDAIVAAYLPLAESLGATQKDTTPLKFDALVSAIHALHGEVTDPEGQNLLKTAATAAEAMNGQPLDKQRELFKKLSVSIVALVDTMPPSASVAGSLFVVNCPMAKADWLQRTRTIANPYYAEDMKECGSVVRPVNSAKGAR